MLSRKSLGRLVGAVMVGVVAMLGLAVAPAAAHGGTVHSHPVTCPTSGMVDGVNVCAPASHSDGGSTDFALAIYKSGSSFYFYVDRLGTGTSNGSGKTMFCWKTSTGQIQTHSNSSFWSSGTGDGIFNTSITDSHIASPVYWWSSGSGSCATTDPGAPVTDVVVGYPAITAIARASRTSTVHDVQLTVAPAASAQGSDTWTVSINGTLATGMGGTNGLFRLTVPEGQVPVTFTITRTLASGFIFANGSNTASATCSVGFDSYRPNVAPVCGQGVPPIVVEDEVSEEDCRFGWSLLHPQALAEALACLFATPGDPVGDLAKSYEGSLMATLSAPVAVLVETVQSLKAGHEYANGCGDEGCGAGGAPGDADGRQTGFSRCAGPKADVPLGPIGNGQTFEFEPLNVCADGPAKTVATGVKSLLSIVFLVGAAFAAAQTVMRAFGFGLFEPGVRLGPDEVTK